MNQRIRELALQSGMTRILNEHAHEYGNGQFENTEYPELAKFAELIVRECMEQIVPSNERISDCNCESTKLKIKQHFGIDK